MSRDDALPGKRVPAWPWLRRIDEEFGRGRNDQRTRKRKVKRAQERRWRRGEPEG